MQRIPKPSMKEMYPFYEKTAFLDHGVLSQIESAINLLCEQNGRCTATDVLRLCKFEETNFSRTVVIEYAQYLEFDIASSGRGFVILDAIGNGDKDD